MKNNNLIVKEQLEQIKSFVDFKTNLELYILDWKYMACDFYSNLKRENQLLTEEKIINYKISCKESPDLDDDKSQSLNSINEAHNMRENINKKIETHKQNLYQFWQSHYYRNDIFLLRIH
jgi:hypothetical protein